MYTPKVNRTGKPRRPKLEMKMSPEERNKKAEPHDKLIYEVLKKLNITSTNPDYEDYFQQGYIALLEAVEGYNPERGANWFTYGFNHIYFRLVKFSFQNRTIRCPDWRAVKSDRYQYISNIASLDAPLQNDEGVTLGEVIMCKDEDYEDVENQAYKDWVSKELSSAIKESLDEKEQQIVHKLFIEKKNQTNAAKELGFNQSYVSRINKVALGKLKVALSEHKEDLLVGMYSG